MIGAGFEKTAQEKAIGEAVVIDEADGSVTVELPWYAHDRHVLDYLLFELEGPVEGW